MRLRDKIMYSKRIYEIDTPTFQTWGKLGLVLYGIAILLVILLQLFYGTESMLIGVGIFICGGFAGRCIQKRLSKN